MANQIVMLVLGLVLGGIAVWLIFKGKLQTATTQANAATEAERATLVANLQARDEEIKKLNTDANELKSEMKLQAGEAENKLSEERAKTESLNASFASSRTENANLIQKLSEQKNEIEQLNHTFTKEFENLANRILDEKSQKFTEQNRTNLDIILNPFKERLKEFEQKVDHAYKVESTERTTLKTEIKNLIDLNKQISEEANNLALALKGDNKQQGDWGELVLERVLQRSGLVEGAEYKTQHVDINAEGERVKPDVVIYLPDNKHVIVDSKVSLVAYTACVNATTEEERQRYLKAHIDSLRNHVKVLGDKNYQTAVGLDSPDFVLLFLPIESSFSLAVQGDAELFNYAWDRKIVVVSPSTLLATLRTIASIWKRERQTRNAIEIADEGGKLYDKFVSFYEDLVRIGKKMDDAKTDYCEAMKKLYDGSGNLVKRAEKMRELGAKTTKQLPQVILDRTKD